MQIINEPSELCSIVIWLLWSKEIKSTTSEYEIFCPDTQYVRFILIMRSLGACFSEKKFKLQTHGHGLKANSSLILAGKLDALANFD